MIVVLIVPTGIEAAIGGHAGDANPVAKLLGACCDTLITHPNVVNASDINEMPENALYVEGSILDRFLEGKIQLQRRFRNRVLVAANNPVREDTVNAVSAARATIGLDAEIIGLTTPFRMVARIENGRATGDVYGWEELVSQVKSHTFDALAIHTPIAVDREMALGYYRAGGVNPWGGVEAKASKLVADNLDKPVAHAPLENVLPDDEELFLIFNERVDPRIAAEAISNCYLHSVLKGLHRAPIIGPGLGVADVDFLVSPFGCFGRPHAACIEAGIPVIVVRENTTIDGAESRTFTYVENYWEAAGVILSKKAGICPASVRRPLAETRIKP